MHRLVTSLFLFFILLSCIHDTYGQTWSTVGTLNSSGPNRTIYTLTVDPFNNLYAGGWLQDSDQRAFVAKWNGSFWQALDPGNAVFDGNMVINSIASDKNGKIYTNGPKHTDGLYKYYIAQWNGSTWSEVGPHSLDVNYPGISTITTDLQGNVYVGGLFKNEDGKYFVAKWNGTTWAELGTGSNALNANGRINALCADTDGNIYAGGGFVDENNHYYIAKWNGVTWESLPTDIVGTPSDGNDVIQSIAIDKEGSVYTSGYFYNSLTESTYVLKWDGSQWNELTDGITYAKDQIFDLEFDSHNNLYIGAKDASGKMQLFRWDGSIWTVLKDANNNPLNGNTIIWDLAIDSDDNVYAAGQAIYQTNPVIVKWSPSMVTAVQAPVENKIEVYPNPVNTSLSFQAEEPGELQIYDATGHLFLKQNCDSGKVTLHTKHLKAGKYFMLYKTSTRDYAPTELIIAH